MPHTDLNPIGLATLDLAPGDARAAAFDWKGFSVTTPDRAEDPKFALAYDALWREFGAAGEMESKAVLANRLTWKPEQPHEGRAMLYRMAVVLWRGELAAVRDHTVVVTTPSNSADPVEPVTVHLSHLLIAARWRGSGLGGWLRAAPLKTARECLLRSNCPPRPIDLVAEMEPADLRLPNRFRRLTVYERVGFKKLDPARIDYQQPDFRPPDMIDRDGRLRPVPLSLSLIVRRVGRETDSHLPAAEAKALVANLYHLYGRTVRPADMAPLWKRLETVPGDGDPIGLVPPTKV